MIQGIANVPKMDGQEVRPGITLIEEPSAIEGTNKLRCLANVFSSLCVVELSIKFVAPPAEREKPVR